MIIIGIRKTYKQMSNSIKLDTVRIYLLKKKLIRRKQLNLIISFVIFN